MCHEICEDLFFNSFNQKALTLAFEENSIFHSAPRKGNRISQLPFMLTFLISFCCFPVRTWRTSTLFFVHRILELEGKLRECLVHLPNFADTRVKGGLMGCLLLQNWS